MHCLLPLQMSTNAKPTRYQVPSMLRDLVLLDMLELTGSTVVTAQLLHLSQPTVSRRSRLVMKQLGLVPCGDKQPGQRFSAPAWLQLLRQGVNRHRHDCGVLRLGGDPALQPALAPLGWVEWVPLPTERHPHWPAFLTRQLLDGLVLPSPPPMVIRQRQQVRWMTLESVPGSGLRLLLRSEPLVLSLAQRHACPISGPARA